MKIDDSQVKESICLKKSRKRVNPNSRQREKKKKKEKKRKGKRKREISKTKVNRGHHDCSHTRKGRVDPKKGNFRRN